MSRFRHSVVLEPVPRDWFEDNVGFGHDALTEYLGVLPLAGGEHLSPGAWYSADEFTVTVESWNRRAETSAQLTIVDEGAAAIVSARLVSASAPRVAELAGDVRLTRRFGWLTRFRGNVRADLERWWHGTTRADGQPVIEGWVKHSMVRASFTITPSPAQDGGWRVAVDGRLRARGVLGPLAALGLRIFRAKLRHTFVEGMNEFAEEWNREVPELLASTPDALRKRFLFP